MSRLAIRQKGQVFPGLLINSLDSKPCDRDILLGHLQETFQIGVIGSFSSSSAMPREFRYANTSLIGMRIFAPILTAGILSLISLCAVGIETFKSSASSFGE